MQEQTFTAGHQIHGKGNSLLFCGELTDPRLTNHKQQSRRFIWTRTCLICAGLLKDPLTVFCGCGLCYKLLWWRGSNKNPRRPSVLAELHTPYRSYDGPDYTGRKLKVPKSCLEFLLSNKMPVCQLIKKLQKLIILILALIWGLRVKLTQRVWISNICEHCW